MPTFKKASASHSKSSSTGSEMGGKHVRPGYRVDVHPINPKTYRPPTRDEIADVEDPSRPATAPFAITVNFDGGASIEEFTRRIVDEQTLDIEITPYVTERASLDDLVFVARYASGRVAAVYAHAHKTGSKVNLELFDPFDLIDPAVLERQHVLPASSAIDLVGYLVL